jgi:hypothetical protein
VSIAAALDMSEDEVVGKLHRLWSWADRHTTDGTAPGITAKWVDRYIVSGFSAAMLAVGWLRFTETGVEFPGFDKHNGDSAKRRGEAAIRQRLSRKSRDMGVTGVTRDCIPRPFIRHVMERDAYTCVYCGTQSDAAREAGKKALLSVDHIVPVARGGLTAVANLVCCCRLCNREKNDRTPTEWGLEPSFLQPGVAYGGETVGVTGVSQEKCDEPVTREEKSREEKKGKSEAAPVGALLASVDPDVVKDFQSLRQRKKAPLTLTALEGIIREAGKAGLTLESALRLCCERGWTGFNADWDGVKAAAPKPASTPGGGRREL